MRQGGILCLDLAGMATGWAYGHPGDAAPSWGVWRPERRVGEPDIGRGQKGHVLETALDDIIEDRRPVGIFYEAPLAADQQGNTDTAFILIGLAMIVEATADRWRIPVKSRGSGTYRSAVIGRSQLTEEERQVRPKLTVKTAIVAPWIASMGWDITDHNAADAAVIFAYETGIRHANFGRRRMA